jgi:hypothetical protein
MRGKTLIEAAFNDEMAWTSEELADFMAEHEDWFEECPLTEAGNHDPFQHGALLHNVPQAASKRPNGRSKTGACTCTSAGKYKQSCKCKLKSGKISTRIIDMSTYYASGKKAAYMRKWREVHGPHAPKK